MEIKKENWKKVKLGNLYKITSGGTPLKSKSEYYRQGTIPWVRTGDLKDKFITDVDGRITEIAIKETSAKLFPKGTVLLAMYGATIGACSILSIDAATNQACAAFLPNHEVDSSYLYYFFKYKQNDLVKLGVGGAQPNISAAILKNITFSYPSMNIQKQIVNILDNTLEIINSQKKQLDACDNLIKSIFHDMFGDPKFNEKGWVKRKIKDVAVNGLSYGTGASAIPFDGVTRYIRITDINNDGSLSNEIVSPSEVSEKYLLKEGDILFARSGATVGKSFRFRKSHGNCVYAGYLIKMTPDQTKVLPEYVFSITKTDYYKHFIESNKKTVAQPNINARQYGDLEIPVPPLDLQNRFAEIVTKIEEQKALVKKAIEETQTLFDSLMSKYFDD